MAFNKEMVLLTALLLVTFNAAVATEITVGGDLGWTIPNAANGLDYKLWANISTFMVGDSLVFNYNPSVHNVLSVGGDAFAACDTSAPLAMFNDGKTVISLDKAGRYWFICGTPNHCKLGQAFKVTVIEASDMVMAPAPVPDAETGAANSLPNFSKTVVILSSILLGVFNLL